MSTLNYSSLIILALKDLARPKVILAIILPFVASILLWIGIGFAVWGELSELVVGLLNSNWVKQLVVSFPSLQSFLETLFSFTIKFFFVFLIVLPLMTITATILVSIFLVPVLVAEIKKTDFPSLIKKSSSIFTGTATTLSYSIKYFLSWLGSIPLWFVPFAAIIIPFLLLSWFNSRVFTFEVLTEVAGTGEIKTFIEKNGRQLFILGCMTGLLYWIPFVNLIAPLITSAVFSRFCITQYAKERLNHE